MAIHFNQDVAGLGEQSLLRLTFGAQASLPYTIPIWVNAEGTSPSGTQIWGINNNIWGNSGNGYFLETSNPSGSTFKLRIAIRRTYFGPDFDTATTTSAFDTSTWLPCVILIHGSGITPTLMELYVDGALEATLTPDGLARPYDTFPYIHVGGYWATGVGATGDTAFSGCAAYNAMYNTLWGATEIAAFSSGTPPSEILPDSRIYDLQMLSRASAGTSLVGSDFDVFENLPSAPIEDCENEPDVTPTEPEPEPEPTPTPGQSAVTGTVRALKPYEKPPIAIFRVGDARSKFPLSFFVFEANDLRVTVDEVELGLDEFTFAGEVVPYPGYDETDATVATTDYHRKQASVPGFRGGTVTLDTAVTDCVVCIWNDPPIARGSPSDQLMRRDLARSEFNGRIAGRMFGDLWTTYRAQKLKFSRCVATADTSPLDEDMSGTLLIQ